MKRFVSLFVALMMLSTVSYAKIDESTIIGEDVFKYTGSAPADKLVSITVLKPSETLEDLDAAADKLSVLTGYKEARADAEGKYEIDLNFGSESGLYEAYTGIEGSSEPVHGKIHYVNKTKNAEAFAFLKEKAQAPDSTGIKEIIEESSADLGVDAVLLSMADDDTITKMAEIMYKEANDTTLADAVTASAYLDKALAVSLFNAGKIDAFGEYMDKFVTDDTLSQWLNKPFITQNTKDYMNAKIIRGTDSFETFDKSLTEAVALGLIRDADGYGSITSYLTAYADVLDIDASDVTDAFAQSVIGNSYDSIDSTNIDTFVPDTTTQTNNDGGKRGGSLGGFSVKGTEPVIAEPIVQDENRVESGDFTDLAGYQWASEAISGLYNAGVINGRAEGIYAPAEPVLREEFVKMVLTAGKFEDVEGSISFTDVKEGDWYYEYIRNAFACDIINGVSDTLFGVGYEITRQDMAVICYNMLTSKGIVTANDIVNAKETAFADKDDISDYAVTAVEYLSSRGILTGDENNMFNPKVSLNRAEAAAVIYRAYLIIEGAQL